MAVSAGILLSIAAFSVYYLYMHSTNQAVHVMIGIAALLMSTGALVGLLWFWTFRQAQQHWLKLLKVANRDQLTGLPNQQKLLRDLEKSEHTNLAFMKITNYNSILNSYGPAVTDDVMKQVASVLVRFEHEKARKTQHYYIQPGVFSTLEDQFASYDTIAQITKALVKKLMSTQYQVGDGDYIAINVTVGAVRQKEDAYILANMALQEAENNKLQFYLIDNRQSQLPATYKKELRLTQTLLQGIHERRVVAYFQPIFHADSLTVAKYECLSRLVDEQGNVISMPGVFMPLAHRANVYYLLSQIMIKHAVDFASKHDVVVTINFSITDINNKRTCDYLFHKIKKSGVGHLIQFELLENEVVIDARIITKFILQLHELGCQVGMDDLGKGYSNIERLFSLPIDFVKIDRTIMENISHNREMRKLAKGIVRLAQNKNLEVVAEYCSDAELTDLAIKLGVDYLQGFYLGRPKPHLFEQPVEAMAQER